MARPVFPDPHPLLHYRALRDISTRKLARKARFKDWRRLAVIERGLSITEIRRLARVLQCNPADLRQHAGDRHAA